MRILVPQQLETERLILRQFQNNDWRELYAYYADSEVTKYTVGRALTEGETWRTMASMVGHWTLHGYGPYAITERESGKILGVVGFWYPADWPEPEIKWGLIRKYWGKGYAKEAALAVHAAGLKYLPNLALISFIDKDNKASIRLAQRLGATFEKEVDFRGGRFQIYRHKTG